MTTDTTTSSSDTGAAGPAPGSFVLAHVEQLLDNPADARAGERDQASLLELASSIRTVGLLQALTVVPDPDDPERFVIYAGHRRRDAARLAAGQLIAHALGYDVAADPTLVGLDVDPASDEARREAGPEVGAAADRVLWLPCLVRPDLAAEVGMDLAAGLIENGVRDALTTGQRARAAGQLSLADGWTVTKIATATGLSRRQARAAAALPRLGDAAREATYRGELSLEHAAVLDDLAAEGATGDELGLLARSGTMFDHHVAELGKTLRRRATAADLRDESDTRGWTLYDEPEGYPLDSALAPLWSLSRAEDPDGAPLLPRGGEGADPAADSSAAAYALLPGHGVLLHNDPWEDPHLEVVCADPDTHGYRRDPRSMLYVDPDPGPDHGSDPAGRGGEQPAPKPSRPAPDPAAGHDDAAPASEPGEHHAGPGGTAPDNSEGRGTVRDTATEPSRVQADAAQEGRRADAALEEQRRAETAALEEQHRVEAERRAAERAAENERIEAERAAAQARRDAVETAAETRWAHTASLLRTQKGAAAHVELPAVVLARFPWLLGEVDDVAHRAEIAALCAEPDRDSRSGEQRWSSGRITHRAVVITAWLLHQNLTAAFLLQRSVIELIEAEPAIWWFDYLTARGYQPAEVETQARTVLEEIVTEGLAAEHGDGDDNSGGAHGGGPDPH